MQARRHGGPHEAGTRGIACRQVGEGHRDWVATLTSRAAAKCPDWRQDAAHGATTCTAQASPITASTDGAASTNVRSKPGGR